MRLLVALTKEELGRFFPDGFELRNSVYEVKVENPHCHTKQSWHARLVELEPDVLLAGWCTPPLETLGESSNFPDYVCHLGGSVRSVVPRSLLERGAVVTNWGALVAPAVAEHALLLILGSLRNMAHWPKYMRDSGNKWELHTRSFYGLRVGIHGFGRIARALVPLLKPFEVEIHAYSAGVPDSEMKALGVAPCPNLAALFSDANVLVECEALTPATYGSVTRELLSALPHGSVFVNVGRASVVDEVALRDLTAAGHLRTALDVHEQEQWDNDSPWTHIPGTLHSPHIAGPTNECYEKCGRLALENLRRFSEGSPLLNVVDLKIYDRST